MSKPLRDLRAGAHRGAEAGAAGDGAVDRHDEGLAAPVGVVLVDVGTAAEHLVVDGEGREIAGPYAQEGHARRIVVHVLVVDLVTVAAWPGRWARWRGR